MTAPSTTRLPPDIVLAISGFSDDGLGGGLFLFDGHDIEQVDSVSCTGLSVGSDRVVRALRASAEVDSTTELLTYDRRGIASYRRVDAVGDPHDVHRLDDGWLVVSSVDNAIFKVADSGCVELVWQGSSVADSWHPNCLAVADGDLWVSVFGAFDTTRGWLGDRARGTGFLLNTRTGQQVSGLSHPHSPRRVGRGWLVCNSHDRTVVRRGDTDTSWHEVVQLEGYTRGLAVVDDVLYVGESATRDGDTSRARLAVVRDGRVVRRLPLPCAEIYDIVAVPRWLVAGLRTGFATNSQRIAESAVATLFAAADRTAELAGIGGPLEPGDASVAVRCSPPASMRPGDEVTVAVTLVNDGTVPLASVGPHPVHLASYWVCADGTRLEGARSILRRALRPGDRVDMTLSVSAPAVAGDHALSVSLVQEGRFWFDAAGDGHGVRSTIEVGAVRPAHAAGSEPPDSSAYADPMAS